MNGDYLTIMKDKSLLQIQAYDYIKDRILSGELSPNTLYSETKFSAQIGISRTPMREALQCLSQDGYISIVPSKGFMIRQLNEKDMLESIQVRCAIEGFCTYIIASEIHTEKGQNLLKNLKFTLDNMELSIDKDDNLESFIYYDHQFHLLLVNYMHNDEFNQIFQRLLYLIHLTSENTLSIHDRIQETFEEHTKYYEALKKGDIMKAYQCIIDHLIMPLKVSGQNLEDSVI